MTKDFKKGLMIPRNVMWYNGSLSWPISYRFGLRKSQLLVAELYESLPWRTYLEQVVRLAQHLYRFANPPPPSSSFGHVYRVSNRSLYKGAVLSNLES
jgi:hypothetical protein